MVSGQLRFALAPLVIKSLVFIDFEPHISSLARLANSYTLTDTLEIETNEDEILARKIRSEHRGLANSSSLTNTMGPSSSRQRTRPRPVVDLDESDGSPPEDEVETPSKRKQGMQKQIPWNEDGEETDDLPPQFRRKTKPTRSSTTRKSPSKAKGRRQKTVTLSSDTGEESDDVPITSSSRQRRAVKQQENGIFKTRAIPVDDDDSDDEGAVLSSINRRRTRISVQEDAESSDEEPISSPLKKRRRRAAIDSEDSDIRSSPPKRRKQVNDDDEDDDSDLPSVKNITSRRIARPSTSSSSASTIPNRVTRQAKGRKHRTEREKKMELLKRKRAGEDIEELTDSTEASSEPKKGVYDTDSSLEMLSIFEDESEPELEEKPKKKRKPDMNSYQLEEDSDFVVEDDEEGPLGVPLGLLDIPLKFRHAAHKPMKEHFKDAIEWMVHRKINPGFNRNDEIYLQAFTKLDDEYQGYAKSKFVSSQWTAEFTRAIYARPILIERPISEAEGLGPDGLPKCDVCNHRKHFPRFALHFEGKAYYKSTLEEVEKGDSDDDSDADSDDDVSVNSQGHSLPAEDKEWNSGM